MSLQPPTVDASWNSQFRGYSDGTFRWNLVDDAYSYRLELTPDLGWGNEEVQFDPFLGGEVGNSRLITIPGLRTGIDLVGLGDGTATFTVPVATMKRLLAPGFDKYLWRVIAVSIDNEDGDPSLIQRFRGRVAVYHLGWTLDPLISPSRSVTTIIRGNREPFITSIEVNGQAGHTSFPSPTTWQADVPLVPGRNVLFVRVYDSQGNGSEYRHVEIEMTKVDLKTETYFNRFDDFGYALSLERLPGERNLNYRERIKDVLVHRASPTYAGIMNAIGRELDLTYNDEALSVEALDAPEGSRYRDVVVWLTARHFYVKRAGTLRRLEYQQIEGRTWRVRPDYYVEGEILIVELAPGVPVSRDDYKVYRDADGPFLQFTNPDLSGRTIYLTYSFAIRIDVIGKTVQEVVDSLNDVEIDGRPVVTVTRNSDVDGDARAEGLQHFPPAPVGYDSYRTAGNEIVDKLPVRWMPVELDAFCDPEFKWRFTNENGTQFGTEYAGWAERLRSKLKTSWGYLIADSACWSAPWLRTSGIGSLDTIHDAYCASWMTTRGGKVHWVHPGVAIFRNLQDPRDGSRLVYDGVPYEWIVSGYGYGYALMTYIDERRILIESEEEEFTVVRQSEPGDMPDLEDLGFDVDGVDSEVV